MRPVGPHTVLFVSQASEVYAVDTRTRQWTKARIRETAAMTLPREPLVTPSRMLGEPLADGTWPILPLPGKPSMLARDARQDAEKRLWVMSRTGLYVRSPSGAWRRLTEKDGLLEASTQALGTTKDGSLWIGYDSPLGISRLRAKGPDLEHLKLDWQHLKSPVRNAAESTFFLRGAHRTRWFVPANVATAAFAIPGVARAWWLGGGTLGMAALLLWWRRQRQHEVYQKHKAEFFARAQHARARHARAHRQADEPHQWTPGMLLRGRYRIRRLVAQGGFSFVYEAWDEASATSVAIKQLKLPSGDPPPDAGWMRKRFAQEVAAVGLVRDPGVLPVLDYWVDELSTPHLAFSFVDGPTRRQYLNENGTLPRHQTLEVLTAIAQAVTAAHAQSVVHCDIKPENILLAPRLLAPRLLHLQADLLSANSRPIGTLSYMAPEQLLGQYSKATDVYCFALLALELLTGQRYADLQVPFDDQWPNALRKTLTGLCGLRPPGPALFVEALQFDPQRRAAEVDVWFAALLRALAE